MGLGSVRVAVVGAGISGLTLAIALRRHGISVDVFEDAPELGEVGAAVALAANSSRLLARLGLDEQLRADSVEPTELIYRSWNDDRPLVTHPIGVGNAYQQTFGASFHGIHRAALQSTLSAACGRERLHMGKRLVSLRDVGGRIRLEFADDTDIDADVVIGADGVNSVVRSWVTNEPPPIYSQTSGFRGLVPMQAVPSLPEPRALQFWMGPGAHILHYPIKGDLINFLAVIDAPVDWPSPIGPEEAEPGELASHFAGWNPAVLALVNAVPQSARWPLLSQPSLRRWSRERVALIGDAAHAMLPHHGQGANQAIEDAVTLADCLAETGIGDYAVAFDRYQRARQSRTRKVQLSSWATSRLLHLPDGPEVAERNKALGNFVERFGWIHSFDAQRMAQPTPVAY